MHFRTRLAVVFAMATLAGPAFAQIDAADEAAEAADDAAEAANDAAEIADGAEDAAEEAREVAEAAEEAEQEAEEEAEAEAPAPSTRTFESYANENPAPSGPSAQPWRQITEAELLEPSQSYPYVEWHGYFRFRADSFWNLDLDTAGTSPILPPIEALLDPDTDTQWSWDSDTSVDEDGTSRDNLAQYRNNGAEHIAGANIRMRLRPTFHVTEKARIHLEMNILDNVVLGSTPDGFNEGAAARAGGDGLRIDMPVLAFSGGQEPPNWFNSGGSSLNVTQAYGEVNSPFGTIRVGRMASHWGLGMLANGGGSYSSLNEPRTSYRGVSMAGHGCLDCDYGDYVDRAMFVTNMFDHYIALAWDYNYSGPTDISPFDYYGQPREISNYDDVRSYIISIFNRPLRPEEIAIRNRELKELRQPAFDYGAYFVIRRQDITAEATYAYENVTDYTFIARDARAFIPDVWFRLQSEPRFRQRLRLEGEFAAILGTIENANPDPQSAHDPIRPREIRQFGAALEFEYVNAALATGLNGGFASGRTLDNLDEGDPVPWGFGVEDEWVVSDVEPTLTNFRFDRNYFVDNIMFREIIGTITNAIYVNPFFQYDLFAKQDDTLGMRLDLIGGFAANPDVTPSGDGFYGVETDLTLFWREPRFGTDLTAGLYIPGSAFDGVAGRRRISSVANTLGVNSVYEDGVSAGTAWTVQGRFFWAF